MTVGRLSVILVVVLMVVFCRPELIRFCNFGFNIETFFLERFDELDGSVFLLFIKIKNARAILCADIGPLTIQLRKIVRLEKQPGQFLVVGFGRIIEIGRAHV